MDINIKNKDLDYMLSNESNLLKASIETSEQQLNKLAKNIEEIDTNFSAYKMHTDQTITSLKIANKGLLKYLQDKIKIQNTYNIVIGILLSLNLIFSLILLVDK